MMGQTVEQSRCHLRIAEYARPLTKGEIGRDNHRGPLVEAADQMEPQLPTSLGERQIAEFVENDEVEAGEIIGEAPLASGSSFGLEPVDQIDGIEEPTARSGADAVTRDRHRQACPRALDPGVRLARTGPSDQDDIALLGDQSAAGEVAHQTFVDRRAVELKTSNVLGQRQFGDGQLILD